jgi:hypothetical protein
VLPTFAVMSERWRGRQMALRWAVAGILEAQKGFRRCRRHNDMRALVNALRARDDAPGLTSAAKAAQNRRCRRRTSTPNGASRIQNPEKCSV